MLRTAALLAVLLSAAAPLSAQDPVPPPPAPPPSEPVPDSVAVDSVATPDSLATRPDSTSTERLLAVEGQQQVRLPVPPLARWGAVQPRGSRIVLPRDSLEWMAVRTVGDLLAAAAPVFLWRGGWLVVPELPNLRARGAGSVEYLVDGLPWQPLGTDTVAVDPSAWAVDLFDRVEVEQLPGMLRVHLFTRNHDRLAPRTTIGVSTGDRGLSRYHGSFERRWQGGFGLTLAADYHGVNAPAGGSGGGSDVNGLARLSWVPSSRLAITAQMLVQAIDRDTLFSTAALEPDTLYFGLSGQRQESQLRASWRRNNDGMGLSADLWAARSRWTSDSVEQDIGTFGAQLGYRRPTWSAESRVLHHTEWTPLDTRLAFGWSPLSLVSASVDGVYQEHSNDRISQYATARVGLSVPRGTRVPLVGISLPVGLELGGTVSHGERVDAPALWELPTAEFSDYELMASVDFGRRLKAEARWQSLDAWQPLPYAAFPLIPSLARQPRTEWLSLKAQLAPTSWFSVASHYEHPQHSIIPDGAPPHHAWTTATISSRFLRNFPSGIFRLKVQGVVETWSPGVIGRDAEGEAIEMKGLTFVRGIIQLKIGPFVAYWDRVNFQANRNGHIPGYQVMSLGSSYGIRWEFAN